MFTYFNKILGKLNYKQTSKFSLFGFGMYNMYDMRNNIFPQRTNNSENQLANYIIQTYPSCEYKDEYYEQENEQELIKKFISGQVFVKTFHNNRWPGFAEQLQDYTKRPKIRYKNKYSTKEKPAYKYDHLKDEIIICRSKEEELKYKKNKHYTHTKKSSVSYISPRLCTVLFTSDMSEGSETIGLIFNVDDCIIRAMFLKDYDTTQRAWKSYSQTAVEDYRRYYLRENRTLKKITFDEFKKHVDARQPRFYNGGKSLSEDWWFAYRRYGNEVLAKLSLNAVIGVVYTQDTIESKESAIERQKEIEEKFKKNVPIIYYNADYLATKKVSIYTKEMQKLDLLSSQLNFHSQKKYNNKEDLIAALIGIPVSLSQDFKGVITPEKIHTVLEAINLVNQGLINRKQAQAYIENICDKSEEERFETSDTSMRNSL